MKAGSKVVMNTGILYGRMLITMGISLYATRLVLDALGSIDYGIFNLIAGIILMLSFLNSAMTVSTQRYLSFYQGKKDPLMQKKVFGNSLILHFIIGILVVGVIEIVGIFLFDGFLNIPSNRIAAARIIYHFMSVTVFFSIIAVPFNGSLVAHENMMWVAIVNITEAVLKLAIALIILQIDLDRLVMYGVLTASISFISFLLYAIFCLRKYEECQIKGIKNIDRNLLKELSSFAGWNLFGSICSLARSQGLAILLNVFFGAGINSAYGIANQVSGQLKFLSSNLLRAINPQIMKSEGGNDRARMLRMAMIASKFGFFLFALLSIPCIFEMDIILNFWLKDVPEFTVIFCQLIMIGMLTNQLTIGLQSANQAIGKVKVYMSVTGSLILFNLPLAYLLLKLGFAPHSVLVSFICIESLACLSRLYFLKKQAGLSIKVYINRVFLREAIPVLISTVICVLMTNFFVKNDYRFIYTVLVSAFCFSISIYLVGLCKDEREIVNKQIGSLIAKLTKSVRVVSIK